MKNMLRKTVGVMLILLILLSSFTACVNDNTDASQPSGDVGENKPSEDKGEGEDNIPEEAPDANQPSEDNTQAEAGIELTDEDSDLISALIDFLEQNKSKGDRVGVTIEDQINKIRNGAAQPLLIDIDPDKYFFVCGYYIECEHKNIEKHRYFCASEYTWVKYENVSDIKEKYNGMNCIVAFQLNESSLTKDILTDDEEGQKFVHFKRFYPEFVEGLNAKSAETVEKTFIYLNKSESETIYYSTSLRTDDLYTIYCIKLDEQYYIHIDIGHSSSKGESSDKFSNGWIASYLGEYYDAMMKIMIRDKYTETSTVDCGIILIYHYGLFEINELVDEVIRK